MNESEVEEKANFFVAQYAVDVSSDLVQEIMHLKAIHTSNLGEKTFKSHSAAQCASRNVIDGYISQLLRSSSHLLHVAGYSS